MHWLSSKHPKKGHFENHWWVLGYVQSVAAALPLLIGFGAPVFFKMTLFGVF